ncbi:MAG: EamA family transporter, partial [Pseudomonas aeruginosa]|nr:EamA family transporter [Pseudomonas aeruginosa]
TLALPFEPLRVEWRPEFVLPLLWMAVVISVLATFLLYRLIQRGNLVQVTSLFYLIPAVTALLDYLLHGGERPELGETILLAPLVRPRAWGWSKLSYRLLSPFVDSIPRRFSENSSDPQFLDFLREHDPLQPRTLPTAWVGALTRWVPRIERAPRRALSPLVVQGESDETVDWRHGLKVLREKFDEPRILLLEEARHHLANESEGLRRRYFDFLSDALGA